MDHQSRSRPRLRARDGPRLDAALGRYQPQWAFRYARAVRFDPIRQSFRSQGGAVESGRAFPQARRRPPQGNGLPARAADQPAVGRSMNRMAKLLEAILEDDRPSVVVLLK